MPSWPWSSGSSTPPSSTTSTTPQPPPLPTDPQPTIESTQPKSTSNQPTRDELANLELQQLLSQLNDPSNSPSDPPPQDPNTPRTITSAPSFSSTDRERIAAASQNNEEYVSTFPTTMNCLHAFDRVWYCYSLGGQFLNVYRYGSLRDCSEQSADWRFCMRTKVYSETTRRAMILQHYKQKAAKYKQGPSSEDIWSVRTTPAQDAFTGWTKEEDTSAEDDDVLVQGQP